MKDHDQDPKNGKKPAEDLSEAASEWQPDAEAPAAAGPRGVTASNTLNPEGGNDYVALIDTPFNIKTIEISEAQQMNDELVLDEGLTPEMADLSDDSDIQDVENELPSELIATPQDDSQLENLARAIEEQNKKLEAEALVAAGQTEEMSAEELARQIAEDQALSAQMAQDALDTEMALELDPELLAALPREPQPDAQGNMDLSELQSCIETLLFMMDKPVSAKKLQDLLGPTFKKELFTESLAGLQARYQGTHHGIELIEVAGGWQLRTKPGRAALAKKLAKVQTQRLSTGGMESLAIIAYRQPTMKEEIDKIRGVDSSYFIRGLLDKKLIAITGRSELPGRPMLYSTTDHFLELFGLKDLTCLPSLRELEQMVPASQSGNPEDEDPRVREMRRLVSKMKSDTSTTLLYNPEEDERILTEIRERVQSIPTSTPYLDEQKALEKAAKVAAQQKSQPENQPEGAQLDFSPEAAGLHPEAADVPPSESIDEPEPTTDQV